MNFLTNSGKWTRSFHATASRLAPNIKHRLIWLVDWDKVHLGYYAVVNPLVPTSLIYLSEREFTKRLNVIESNDRSMTVIASPTDIRPTAEAITAAGNPRSQISPPILEVPGPIPWSRLGSRLRKKFTRSFVDSGLFVPTPNTMRRLLIRWMRDLWHMSGYSASNGSWYLAYIAIIPVLVNVLTTQGNKGLVLFLKTSLVCVTRYLARQPVVSVMRELGYPLRLAHGLPAWLPVEARAAIRTRSIPGCRFWISVLYIYKVFHCPWDTAKAIFSVLSKPLEVTPEVESLLSEYRTFLEDSFVPRVVGKDPRPLPVHNRHQPLILTHAGPNGSPAIEYANTDARAWWELSGKPEERGLCDSLTKVCTYHQDPVHSQYMALAKQVKKPTPSRAKAEDPSELVLGRIHLLTEPAGKVRPVALVDYWTQRALYPLHNDLFRILETIPQDGTHSQDGLMASLKELWEAHSDWNWSSLDISSATDKIPVELYVELLAAIYHSRDYAQSVITLMTDREFSVSVAPDWLKGSTKGWKLRYGRGQPMGMFASFALLAMWHHSWIQFASYRANGFVRLSYGVTGDDSVIAEPDNLRPVASEYLSLCSRVGIPISMAKSYQSSSMWSFLSRLVIPGGEISPASLKEELSITGMPGRIARAVRLVRRGWVKLTETNWLNTAIKFVLNPDEYREYVVGRNHGCLTGLVQRALVHILSPRDGFLRQLGFAEPTVTGFLGAIAREVGLLCSEQAILADNFILDEGLEERLLEALSNILEQEIDARREQQKLRLDAFWAWFKAQGDHVKYLLEETWVGNDVRVVEGQQRLIPYRQALVKKFPSNWKTAVVRAHQFRGAASPDKTITAWADAYEYGEKPLPFTPPADGSEFEFSYKLYPLRERVLVLFAELERIELPKDWTKLDLFARECEESHRRVKMSKTESRVNMLVTLSAMVVPELRERLAQGLPLPKAKAEPRWQFAPTI